MSIRSLLAAAATLALTACASPSMQAQWTSPQLAAGQLRGATVWVECAAREPTLARICEDQLAGELVAAGVKVFRAAPTTTGASGGLAAARSVGAVYVMSLRLETDTKPASGGATLGIGLGGGSWGSHGGGGVSTGLALPILGAGGEALVGQGALQKVAGGEVLWSGTASSGAGDPTEQIQSLARTTVDALRKTGAL